MSKPEVMMILMLELATRVMIIHAQIEVFDTGFYDNHCSVGRMVGLDSGR